MKRTQVQINTTEWMTIIFKIKSVSPGKPKPFNYQFCPQYAKSRSWFKHVSQKNKYKIAIPIFHLEVSLNLVVCNNIPFQTTPLNKIQRIFQQTFILFVNCYLYLIPSQPSFVACISFSEISYYSISCDSVLSNYSV